MFKLFFTFFCVCFFAFIPQESNKKQALPDKDHSKNIYYGVVTNCKSVYLQDNVLSNPRGEITALFSVIPMTSNSIIGAGSIEAGSVSINGILLKKIYDGGTVFYSDTIGNIISTPYKCAIEGKGPVPLINYDFHSDFPSYTGFASLPDTINLKSNNSILLTEINNADEVEVYISDRLNSTKRKIASGKKFSSGAAPLTIHFIASELNNLNQEQSGTIEVYCYKNSFTTIKGKIYKFQVGFHLQKLGIIFR